MVENRNQHPPFDNNINSVLGLYVYALFDPTTREPFYVGKGGGKHGNDRVLHHFTEARVDAQRNNSSMSAPTELSKVEKIREIWNSGNEVDWKIMRRNLRNESEALSVEAALIDALTACGFKLLNVQGGHRGSQQGLLEHKRLYEAAARPILGADFPAELMNRPLFIFNIGNAVGKMWESIDRIKTPELRPDYVKATLGCWKVGKHWRTLSNGVAFGIVGGISRAAFEIDSWENCIDDHALYRINPSKLEESTKDSVLNRKFTSFLEPVKGYMQRGGFVVCEVSETGERTFRRGSKNRHPDADHPTLPTS
ncbi:LEM-3-like GIY-YIG domain-containing protein [Sulfitobacter sp. 1A12057]|uniref:LEM-3-like GIY-YIG domain-containing protein n=1 Tax=Sulfitobacter sp. 1A12057 TaxID=3368567 RepID=UPI00374575AB